MISTIKKSALILLFISFAFSLYFAFPVICKAGAGLDLRLSYPELMLQKNDEIEITLQGSYNIDQISKIVAYSDNVQIASVYNPYYTNYFTVYAENNGKATITVNVYGDDEKLLKTLKCTVVVGKQPNFEYYGYTFSIDETSDIINILNLPKAFKPKWSSSNNKVAKVDSNGKVTPVGKGTCNIYARIAQKTISYYVDVKWFPNYKSNIIKFNRKKKYIKVKYKNLGKKSMRVNTKGAALWITNKTGYNLKAKSVKIPPKKTKIVKYRIKGKSIKKLKAHSYVYFKIIVDGKTYKAWAEQRVYNGEYEYTSSHNHNGNFLSYYKTRY